jgi:uncharacterized protein (TIGR02145 family)
MFYTKHKKLFFLSLAIWLSIGVIGCKKEKDPEPVIETGTVRDVQHNVYTTVKIGNQWWMAENLRVTVYNDSTAITEILIDNVKDWSETKVGAFCRIDNRYGLYYNWYVLANKKQLAPLGWHIPSDGEWKILEQELGMSAEESNKTSWRGNREAEKLIPEGSTGWLNDSRANVYGTNKSGFSALPGGCRVYNGLTGEVSGTAFFWTSSANGSSLAWYRNLTVDRNNIYRYFTHKNYGFNIRCVKD